MVLSLIKNLKLAAVFANEFYSERILLLPGVCIYPQFRLKIFGVFRHRRTQVERFRYYRPETYCSCG